MPTVRDAAAIAPQGGTQVVGVQSARRRRAEKRPGAFSGDTLSVTESHKGSKVDRSGTAKAVGESVNGLGCGFDIEDAVLVRDPPTQVAEMGVPEEHLLGHAFHTYKLTSPDGSEGFEFQHNVCGRSLYAEGPVDAALFLAKTPQTAPSAGGETTFDLIDVLTEGGRGPH